MSYRNMLARATEGTDAPTPGYIYIDLAKAATGNPTACQDMAVYLTRRLASKTNPNIKHKCCKVIARLCDDVPRNGFRRCIAQDHVSVTAIKESMHFRGTPDPVRGDEPNQKVRIAAKECLDSVYRETPASAEPPPGGGGYGGGGVGNSYGAPPHSGGGGGQPTSLQSRMQGIGNPQFTDPRIEQARHEGQGFSSVVKEAGEVIAGMIKDPLARNIPDVPRHGHSGNLPGYGGPSYGRPPPGSAELSRRTDGQWNMASNRGPGAIQPDYQRDSHSSYSGGGGGISGNSGSVGGSWGNVQSPPSHHGAPSHSTPNSSINSAPGASMGSGGTAVSDGTYERNLVLELCPPGGLKPVPPPDKLASFSRACASLNSDLVCPVLLDCLEDGQPWIIRAKALCAMETSIASGTKVDGTNPYRDFFFACKDEVLPLVAHPRPGISEPARRVLALLGVAPGSAPIHVNAPVAAPVPAANLLDFDDEPPTPQPVIPQQAQPTPVLDAAAASSSMFGGMQVKSSAPPLQPDQAMPAAHLPQAASNLLDFDTVAPVAPSNDAFLPASTESIAVESQAGVASMFDQLNVNDTEDKKDSSNELMTAIGSNGSSAFGFLNANDPPQPPSFDPLKNSQNLTPNSALKKSMQMSPEQMQAMAYQQMMMQQQQMQMQMAMAMQQQMGGTMPVGVPMYPPLGGPPGVRRTPSGGPGAGGAPPMQQFSFAPKPAMKDDKKFDFVKDAMQTAGHKK